MSEPQSKNLIRLPSQRSGAKMAVAAFVLFACSICHAAPPSSVVRAAGDDVTVVSEHLKIFHGPINVGILQDGQKALLIDCGDGRVASKLPELGIGKIERLIFTHHHRDQACGAYAFVAAGTKVGVPDAEREYFEDPAAYWNDDGNHWRAYRSFRPHRLMLVDPLSVDETYSDGDQFTFGPAQIRVIDTPGHTEGAVSYLVKVDGRSVVFSGDCIYDAGQVWDIYSLQKGFSKSGRQIGGYHGFMGDQWGLIESLGRLKQLQPDLLVPSHGRVMSKPSEAIDTLVDRFETSYETYVGISALRHYFPPLFTEFEGRPGQMPIRPGIQPPDCLRHFGTTWMLVSKTGAAFVMDIGSTGTVARLKKMLEDKEISNIDAVWVTHYHFDHTDGIPKFQEEFDSPLITDRKLADVLVNPKAWRLPCLSPEPIRVHRPMQDGQSWLWHEFKLTSFFFPGQTLYHAALLVEGDGLRMLFVGDSHTMSGIDDYCAYNRNWLGREVGFQYCLSLIEKLQPTHIFNCHVNDAFTFTKDEIRFMQANLDSREDLFGQLVPWDHANYGMDASWVRCYPYAQSARAGDTVQLDVVVMNHSAQPARAACRGVLPKGLGGETTSWTEAVAPQKVETKLSVSLSLPDHATPGRYVVPFDIRFDTWELPQFAEAIIDIGP